MSLPILSRLVMFDWDGVVVDNPFAFSIMETAIFGALNQMVECGTLPRCPEIPGGFFNKVFSDTAGTTELFLCQQILQRLGLEDKKSKLSRCLLRGVTEQRKALGQQSSRREFSLDKGHYINETVTLMERLKEDKRFRTTLAIVTGNPADLMYYREDWFPITPTSFTIGGNSGTTRAQLVKNAIQQARVVCGVEVYADIENRLLNVFYVDDSPNGIDSVSAGIDGFFVPCVFFNRGDVGEGHDYENNPFVFTTRHPSHGDTRLLHPQSENPYSEGINFTDVIDYLDPWNHVPNEMRERIQKEGSNHWRRPLSREDYAHSGRYISYPYPITSLPFSARR